MSTHVLLNLLNELENAMKCNTVVHFIAFFATNLIHSIYHIT